MTISAQEPTRPTGADYAIRGIPVKGLLNRHQTNTQVYKLMGGFGYKPHGVNYPDCYYYDFPEDGVSLRFDKRHMLTHIILLRGNEYGFRQYTGELPHGLTWQANRRHVQAGLGKPTDSRVKPVRDSLRRARIYYGVAYESLNPAVFIYYSERGLGSRSARIDYIELSLPKKPLERQ